MSIKFFAELLISILIPNVVGFLSGYLFKPDNSNWYKNLNKPSITPPGFVFPVVWTILYLLMGISVFLVIQSTFSASKILPLSIFALQLGLNFLWSWAFFGRHSIFSAFVIIVLLYLSVIAMAVVFHSFSPYATIIQFPYLLWLSLAVYLNFRILKLN
jgi:tryptophan-rich sensory protein